jgi:hypothetical protein
LSPYQHRCALLRLETLVKRRSCIMFIFDTLSGRMNSPNLLSALDILHDIELGVHELRGSWTDVYIMTVVFRNILQSFFLLEVMSSCNLKLSLYLLLYSTLKLSIQLHPTLNDSMTIIFFFSRTYIRSFWTKKKGKCDNLLFWSDLLQR